MIAAFAYLPADRLRSIATGQPLPTLQDGAILSADISGFTRLTERLATTLGERRGGEQLALLLNHVYEALLAPVEPYGGSVISFSGDAIRCWFPDDGGRAALNCGRAMLAAIDRDLAPPAWSGEPIRLGLKVVIASGPVYRFRLGDPAIQLIDTLAGPVLTRLAAIENLAGVGEMLIDQATAAGLGDQIAISAWRGADEPGGVVVPGPPAPPPGQAAAPPISPDLAAIQPWLLPVVWQRLAADQGEFLTELRPAAALFGAFGDVDYASPEAETILNRYICHVQSIVAHYEGTLLQVTLGEKGNYFYAAFGAPIAHEDDAERAMLAARRMLAATPEHAALHPLRLGLTQGVMRTGAYGSAGRRTYGVLGDAVNLAARLMQHAQPGQILGDAALRGLTAADGWIAGSPLAVKGKAAPVQVWVLGEAPAAAPASQTAYATPMVGRSGDLAALEEHLRAAGAGQGRVVAVGGEAGIGKSRLIAELAGLAAQRGYAILRGECQSYGATIPYLPWHAIWREIFGLAPSGTGTLDEQIARLEQVVGAIDPDWAERVPLLGPLLNIAIPDNPVTASFSSQLRNESLEALLVDYLRAWLAGGPTPRQAVLILEDMHWSDALSQGLLVRLGRIAGTLPLLIVLAHRPLDPAQRAATALDRLDATEITLKALDAAAGAALVAAKLAQFDLGAAETGLPALTARIMDRTQGNPFFIEELLNYLHGQRAPILDPAIWGSSELPISLHSLILSRIDQLSASQQHILKVASVIGRMFRIAWLHGYYPGLGDYDRITIDLDRIQAADLAQNEPAEPELTYLFKHVITREVTYESLSLETRTNLHERLAAYLEASFAGQEPEEIYLLAHHYERSANLAKAREYLRRAGEVAAAAYANDAAVSYFERLLARLDRPEEQVAACKAIVDILEHTNQWNRAIAYAQRALETAYASGRADLIALGHRLFGVMLWSGSSDETVRFHLFRAYKLSRRQGNLREVTLLTIHFGLYYRRIGDARRALKKLRQAIALAERIGDRRQLLYAWSVMGSTLTEQGAYGEAERVLIYGIEQARDYGDESQFSTLIGTVGNIYFIRGDYDKASRYYQEALAIKTRLGEKIYQVRVLDPIGMIEMARQNFARARQIYEENVRITREVGDQKNYITSICRLSGIYYLEGDLGECERLLREAVGLARQLNDRWNLYISLTNLADVISMRGEFAEAKSLLDEDLALVTALGNQDMQRGAIFTLGVVHYRAGEYDQARLRLREMINRFRPEHYRPMTIHALAAMAATWMALRPDQIGSQLGLRLAAAADAQQQTMGAWQAHERYLFDDALRAARERLAEADFAAAWEAGQALSLDEALALALRWPLE